MKVFQAARRRGMHSYYTQGIASYYKSGYVPLPALGIAAGGPPPIRARKGLGQGYITVQNESQLLDSQWTPEFLAYAKAHEAAPSADSGGLTAQEYYLAGAPSVGGTTVSQPAGQATAIYAGAPPAVGATVPTASWLDQSTTILGTVIKNSYLAAALGVGALALVVGKKKR